MRDSSNSRCRIKINNNSNVLKAFLLNNNCNNRPHCSHRPNFRKLHHNNNNNSSNIVPEWAFNREISGSANSKINNSEVSQTVCHNCLSQWPLLPLLSTHEDQLVRR